ncbi:MAG: PilN domain-containing protein [Burkholderiaceae bacterium]|nr:PilN domain-containing protein [Burkholderiaceae bacterium]
MILINLLPHREMARQRARQMFNISVAFAAVLGVVIALVAYLGYQGAVTMQQRRNDYLSAEIRKLDEEIKEVASLQQEITALKARQEAVENLQADRNMPVHLMNETVRQLPDGVYLNSIKQENKNVLISGVAQSNERVSELLRNFSRNSPWITRPELVEIVATTVTLDSKEQRRANNFIVRVQLQRASDGAPTAKAKAESAVRPAASQGA